MVSTAVPVDVYLRSSFEPDAEYVDGEIEQRPAGEYDHAAWQEALLMYFRQHNVEWNLRAKPELRVQVAESRFRVPDVTVLFANGSLTPIPAGLTPCGRLVINFQEIEQLLD